MKNFHVFKKVSLLVGLALFAGLASFGLTQRMARAQAKSSEPIAAVVALSGETTSPDTLSVKVGETVQFNSTDSASHRLAFGAGDEHHDGHSHDHESGEAGETLGGKDFGQGEALRLRFDKAGTYQIHDHLHPEISVLVVAYVPR